MIAPTLCGKHGDVSETSFVEGEVRCRGQKEDLRRGDVEKKS